jgi:hypothetical protein
MYCFAQQIMLRIAKYASRSEIFREPKRDNICFILKEYLNL